MKRLKPSLLTQSLTIRKSEGGFPSHHYIQSSMKSLGIDFHSCVVRHQPPTLHSSATLKQILQTSSLFHHPEQKKYFKVCRKILSGLPTLSIVKKQNSIFHHDRENNLRNFHTRSKTMICKRRVIGAIDQGTTSTRFMLFDANDLSELSSYQISHESYYPKPGWVEQYVMVSIIM